jgi:CheY-like chemotaxis protein
MKILVVEDDARIADFLQRGLRPRGFAVDIARDGREGLEKGQESAYRLIVLDRRLPLLSGLQVCRQLRGRGVSTPILMLTALDSTQDVVAGLRASLGPCRQRCQARRLIREPQPNRKVLMSSGSSRIRVGRFWHFTEAAACR